ncbi:MAG TPA: hypothetical protein VGX92_21190 [Pyrinomonadaceae bacterium]|jgi:hypothetical protein|nr:hypothetical protein [Pyrinomonadaceae bacterium]
MKKTIILYLLFGLLSGAAAAEAAPASMPGFAIQGDEAVRVFWQKFKAAVTSGNKTEVASLSKFPIGMSYGVASIRNKSQFLRRYREVFNEQSNAAQCFASKGPEMDAENPKRFTVACPDSAGNEVVIYQFERTRTGWKFVSLDNLNE